MRRFRLPLPLSSRQCRCGRSLDFFGHHRAACSRAGVLGRRGFAVESVAARICREGGTRVATNFMVRDMDLRRLEVVADGLPLFGGVQLAVDTTLVSPLHCGRQDVTQPPWTELYLGRHEEVTYLELVAPRARARLVVWAGEVNGRWSEETRVFLSLLAKARARSETPVVRRRVEQAWRLRWGAMLACTAARAFAASLLDMRFGGGVDGDDPTSQEVVNEARHAGLRG